MSEVFYCHEIDEFENEPLLDEVFNFDSNKMDVARLSKIHKINNCNSFHPLNEKEMEIFAFNGINGDFLRRVGNRYVNTFFNISYIINSNGKILKSFSY